MQPPDPWDKNIVTSSAGPGNKNDCAREDQKQICPTDQYVRELHVSQGRETVKCGHESHRNDC
jgi:hypothetical protein